MKNLVNSYLKDVMKDNVPVFGSQAELLWCQRNAAIRDHDTPWLPFYCILSSMNIKTSYSLYGNFPKMFLNVLF